MIVPTEISSISSDESNGVSSNNQDNVTEKKSGPLGSPRRHTLTHNKAAVPKTTHNIHDALKLVKEFAWAKFDETVGRIKYSIVVPNHCSPFSIINYFSICFFFQK